MNDAPALPQTPAEHPEPAPQQAPQPAQAPAAIMVDTTPHAGGSLNTTPSFFAPIRVPIKPAIGDLEDDTPLSGGFCDMSPGCEACQ